MYVNVCDQKATTSQNFEMILLQILLSDFQSFCLLKNKVRFCFIRLYFLYRVRAALSVFLYEQNVIVQDKNLWKIQFGGIKY